MPHHQQPVHWKHGWEPVANGRALPPRPTLLVGAAGDLEACRTAWAQLQPLAASLVAQAEAGACGAEALEGCVRRFRSLRESLVYEASADVCLAARCWPEALKSLAGLAGESGIYVAAAGAAAGAAGGTAEETGEEERASPAGPSGRSAEEGRGGRSEAAAPGGRAAEMVAAHVLFFGCVPAALAQAGGGGGGGLAAAGALLRGRAALPHLDSPPLRYAVQVLAALSAGDWRRFLRLRGEAPGRALRAVVEARTEQVRAAGLRCLVSAYRSLPAPAAAAMLALGPTEGAQQGQQGQGEGFQAQLQEGGTEQGPGQAGRAALRALLESAAAGGLKGAETALAAGSAWEGDGKDNDGLEGWELTFRT
ncbi:hypothetical protein HYH03_002389 [Edaphochlamys debaryana]|uniref:Uncharacterized protein n=1 Tax=Edaphochlamys debaryana TaxID=47281 RepID=A0A835YAP4_9CHLO|nr:hypothetical protein HYH03_002389 [Edaphochlamys debaryana]|eukprot:KAG2499442.1 hypothetical protein HYH03_002389 [Edaphochlamys debaryana]